MTRQRVQESGPQEKQWVRGIQASLTIITYHAYSMTNIAYGQNLLFCWLIPETQTNSMKQKYIPKCSDSMSD